MRTPFFLMLIVLIAIGACVEPIRIDPEPQPAGWIECASEGEVCSFEGTALVRYGIDRTYAYATFMDEAPCTNEVFGDPVVGTAKTCEYSYTEEEPSDTSFSLDIVSVDASGDDGNVPGNVLDDDLDTRWSSHGSGEWIRFDLGELQEVSSLDIAWYLGDYRYWTFDVALSEDGVAFTTVYANTSRASGLQPERYEIAPTAARYVRITGYGNDDNLWNSITSVRINGQAVGENTIRLDPIGTVGEPRAGDRLIELSAYATIRDGDTNIVHDRRASSNKAVNAPWMWETFGGDYSSAQGISFTYDLGEEQVSLWVRMYAERSDSLGWRASVDGSSSTIKPDATMKYEWVALPGTHSGVTSFAFKPLGPRSRIDVIGAGTDANALDALLVLPEPGPVPDAQIYVAMYGSDANSGTESSPLRTLQEAVKRAVPGDTVLVREGTYGGFTIDRKSGRSDAWITLQAYPGERVILDAYETSNEYAVIWIDNPSRYWVFDGFEIIDSHPAVDELRAFDVRDPVQQDLFRSSPGFDRIKYAVRMMSGTTSEPSSDLIFRNFEVHHIPSLGFSGTANNVQFLNNHLYDIGYPRSGYAWYSSGHNHVYRDNIVHDAVRVWQALTSREPHMENLLMERNLFYRTGRFTWYHGSSDSFKSRGSMGVISTYGGTPRNNVIKNNIFLYGGEYVEDRTHNGLIVNNAFIGFDYSGSYGSLLLRGADTDVVNNVFIDNRADVRDEGTATSQISNTHASTMMYRDPYALDFTVVSGSEVIDAGVSRVDVDEDYFAVARPRGSGWDTGPIER